ncbi:hypothetical protein BC829DRAFT_492953 [Chytridium lagenaria]|nr:hypothetical protein BC829DRAFT_492953 [Chytridium lagenaria]
MPTHPSACSVASSMGLLETASAALSVLSLVYIVGSAAIHHHQTVNEGADIASLRVAPIFNLLNIFYIISIVSVVLDAIHIASTSSTPLYHLIAFALTGSILLVNVHRFAVVDDAVESTRDAFYSASNVPILPGDPRPISSAPCIFLGLTP